MNNLLLTGAFLYNEEQLNLIKNLGYNITFLQYENEKSNLDFSEFTHVVCNSLFLHNEIEKFKNLKFIQTTSAGLDRIPLEYVREKGITIKNATGIYNNPIAEWVVTKILDVYKKTETFYDQQKNKVWLKHKDLEELIDKKVAIVGYGNIGKTIAKKLKAFDTFIYAVDIVNNIDQNANQFIYTKDFKSYIKNMDIIILTLPLNEDTRGIISYNELALMKEKSILVNVARGELINNMDLYNFLKTDNSIRFILDVFNEEPIEEENLLWNYPNVYISPHNSYASTLNNERLFELIYKNLKFNSKEKYSV